VILGILGILGIDSKNMEFARVSPPLDNAKFRGDFNATIQKNVPSSLINNIPTFPPW
jgi:hypothetical protein